MKKYLAAFLVAFSVLFAACSKKKTIENDLDLSGFSIDNIRPFVPGGSALVSVSAPKLKDGLYTLAYSFAGKQYGGGGDAEFKLESGKGFFETAPIYHPDAALLYATSIISSSKQVAKISLTKAFSDSSGFIDATINGMSFRATHMTTSGSLIIKAEKYTELQFSMPQSFVLSLNQYANGPGTFDIPASGSAQYWLGDEQQMALSGKIIVTATSPHLTGTFSFITIDSSIVTGSFMTL